MEQPALRILVLSFYYPPDLSAGSFRANALVKALVDAGGANLQIDVVSTLPNRYDSFSKEALELLIIRHQRWIYNIALRMVCLPEDAEDATQEILIKLLTKLSTFRGESQFRTWLYRLAINHLLNMKRAYAESKMTTFEAYGRELDTTPDFDPPAPDSQGPEAQLLVQEAKIGCTSLSRRLMR